MKYQVIAFDLDGTLLNPEGRILDSSKQAIQQARDKGIKVILVTGRHHTAVKPYYAELGLDTPIICCNGTYVYYPETDEVRHTNPLSAEQCRKVRSIAAKHNIHLLMYSRDAMNYMELNPHMEKFQQWVSACPENVRPNVQQIPSFDTLIDNPNEIIWKFVMSSPNRKDMESAVAELPVSEFSAEWSWIDRVDCSSNGNTKGSKLAVLLKEWNINPQNTIAFGDNHNDISMLTSVGLGVAMGNAENEVKAQAKAVIGSNAEDAIAEYLANVLK